MLRRIALAILFGATVALTMVAGASAFWSSPAVGAGRATTGTLVPPANATAAAVANTSTVSVSWSAAHTGSGTAATGYYVLRVRDSDGTSFAACGTSRTVPTVTPTCLDLGVGDGTYHYVVAAVFATWLATGAPTNSVTVISDPTKPLVSVSSISPTPNANGWNNTAPVVVNLSASSTPGIASITYALDGAAGVVTAGSSVAVTVNTDGVNTITAFATDLLGKTSQMQTVIVRIDRSSPTAPSAPTLTPGSDSGSSNVDGITNVTTPEFAGTAEVGATVTLYDRSTVLGSAVATTGTYTIKSAILSTGTHPVAAKSTDAAGNTSAASPATSVTIDITAPPVPPAPTLSAASDSGTSNSDLLTNVTTPVFTGTAEAGATVTLYDSSTAVGTTTASAGGTWSITAATLKPGPRTLTVTATDPAGNVSASSAATVVTVDLTAPGRPGTPVLAAASDSGRSSSDRITNVTTPTITGSVTPASTVTLYDGSTVIGTTYAGTNTYSLVTATLAEGSHSITATATGAAGNAGVASPALVITVDTTAPAAPSSPTLSAATDTGRSSSDGITNRTTPTIVGTTEPHAVVTIRDAGTAVTTVTTTGAAYSAVPPSALSDGTHPLTAIATDVAGNVSPASAVGNVTVDTVAPNAPAAPTLTAASDTGASSTDGVTRVNTPTFTGAAEANSLVTVFDRSAATGAAATAVGGTYTATTGTLADGSHPIFVRATDVAGNVSAASPVTTVLIDTVAPTVTVNQAAGQADPTTTSKIRFTVVFSEGVTVFTGSLVTLGGTAGATTVVVGNTGPQYDLTVSGMTRAGTVTAAISAGKVNDLAGNANVASTSADNSVTYSP